MNGPLKTSLTCRWWWAAIYLVGALVAINLRHEWLAHPFVEEGGPRDYFRQRHGVELIGPRASVEENPALLQVLDQALRQEQASGGLGKLRRIEVLPYAWYDHAVHEWMLRKLARHQAWYRGDLMTLAPDSSPEDVHHELKHAKTPTDPRLEVAWLENTPAAYYQRQGMLGLLQGRVRGGSEELDEGRHFGFVSAYARLDWVEDLAETASQVEVEGYAVVELARARHPLFLQKVALAEQWGLLAPGTAEHLVAERWLAGIAPRLDDSYPAEQRCRIGRYLEETESILQRFPNNPWGFRARTLRACFQAPAEAVPELMIVLEASDSPPRTALHALVILRSIDWGLTREQREKRQELGARRRRDLHRFHDTAASDGD